MSHFNKVFPLILGSENPLVATHKLLGHTVVGDVPALLANEIFVANGVTWGTPGAGKTSFLGRLVYQQAALNQVLGIRDFGVPRMSIIVLDLKGSRQLYYHVKHTCQTFGMRMKTLAFDPGM